MIAVNDLMRSAEYYRGVLGFEVREIGDSGWRIFERDNCIIRAGHCPDAVPPRELGDHAYFAYLRVDGIDEYFAQVRARGGRILKKLRDEPWGMREFALETIDGHRIMFGSPIGV
ncbi:MAG: bleomycin resistance protein [Chloroflexi bacterium]|nr:MAG: bleomycin resistance protein [Chloroflexota bacterium]